MALDDKVIVTENQVADLYQVRNPERHYSMLREMGLLPLKVKNLTTEEGKALLHFATWVYLSGDIDTSGSNFKPRISGKRALLDYLVNTYFSGLRQKFKYKEKTTDTGNIDLSSNSGAFGRLIHAMGVPIPPKDDVITRKPSYGAALPHYFYDIANSVPADLGERKEKIELLHTLVSILFKDRLKQNYRPAKRISTPYMQLNCHNTEESARAYAMSVTNFLNKVFRTKNLQGLFQGLFSEDSIKIRRASATNGPYELYQCMLCLTPEQLGYLATRNPPVLRMEVKY